MTRVLIVDDHPANLQLLRILLEADGSRVDEARHGAEALDIARRAPPDLIISDLLMPVMDGYTLLREWKADERLREIPFIVYTATYTEPQDERLALDLGADAFIVKPAEPQPFMARIRDILARALRHNLPPPQMPRSKETILLKEYSAVLVHKLEDKAQQLELANRELHEEVTERQQAEATLRVRDEVLRLFVEHCPAAIAMFDQDMRYVMVSRRWLSDYGLDDRDIIGHSHYEIFPDLPPRWTDIHKRSLAGATLRCDEDAFVRADGHTDWVTWEVCPWRAVDGGIGGIIIFSEVVTERKQAMLKIEEYAAHQEWLSRQLLAAQEDERRRVARELHDELGQLLTALKINLDTLHQQCNAGTVEPLLDEGIRQAGAALQQVRDLSLALRPSLLDDLGLAPALRWYTQRQAQTLGIDIAFDVQGGERRLEPVIETACFRIAQEALTNIARHARATHVTVRLQCDADHLELRVRDDGAGFDVDAARQRSRGGDSFGLLGMEERAQLAGGSLAIESAPGTGTEVCARFTLPPEQP